MTVFFVAVGMGDAHAVTMRAATLLANADVVIGTGSAVDAYSSLCGHNAEQISFAAGVAATTFADELRTVVHRHAHDPESIIVRLTADGQVSSDDERAATGDGGGGFEVVLGTSSQDDDSPDVVSLPRRGALVGMRVIVPRARHQAGPLSDLLLRNGATPIALPVIDIVDPDDGLPLGDALDHLADYRWVVFTSQNAVERTAQALVGRSGLELVNFAAVGGATAAALEGIGARVVCTSTLGSAASLVEQFPAVTDQTRVLFPCADLAGHVLEVGLAARGYLVDRVTAYRTVYPPVSPFMRHRAHGAEAIIFTSPSTVTGYLASVGRESCPLIVVSIGPSTTKRANQMDIQVTSEATDRSVDGLVTALIVALERPH